MVFTANPSRLYPLYLLAVVMLFSVASCTRDFPVEKDPDVIQPEPIPEPDDNAPLRLNVVGRYLVDEDGNKVNLHGFGQTYSPFFNENAWGNHDVAACLSYNKLMIDKVLAAGWEMDFIRMHMDPYWSDDPSQPSVRYEGHERFSETRFRKYLDEVFVPMVEYANAKGLYVVMRPPGVSPENIQLDDSYQKFLLRVWDIVSRHPKLKNNGWVMFELANEPINIMGADGTFGSSGDACFANMKQYFQAIVDKIRGNKARNIIWVPGLGYQSQYAGYASHRIEGENIGFAIHVYPGWYGSDAEQPSAELGGVMGGGYEGFQRGWDAQIGPVAEFAPVMVTELDWAPAKYDSSWGKSITGVVGGTGFGANFKYIADNTGNVSWMIFTSQHLLAQFRDIPGTEGNYTFLNDPEACPWPVYHWFQEYAGTAPAEGELTGLEIVNVAETIDIRLGDGKNIIVNALYADGSSKPVTDKARLAISDESVVRLEGTKLMAVSEGTAVVTVSYISQAGVTCSKEVAVNVVSPFSLTEAMFNPSIWETGSFDEDTHTLITGQYGFGGWQFSEGLDLSSYERLIVKLGNNNDCGVSFRLFDKDNYWTKPAMYDFHSSREVIVYLHDMKDEDGKKIDPSHIYIAGFWSYGGKPIIIDSLTLE